MACVQSCQTEAVMPYVAVWSTPLAVLPLSSLCLIIGWLIARRMLKHELDQPRFVVCVFVCVRVCVCVCVCLHHELLSLSRDSVSSATEMLLRMSNDTGECHGNCFLVLVLHGIGTR